jgi:hypothetical protein
VLTRPARGARNWGTPPLRQAKVPRPNGAVPALKLESYARVIGNIGLLIATKIPIRRGFLFESILPEARCAVFFAAEKTRQIP